ncbi:MAG: hypothetical protein ACSHXD_10935 [Marinosulfonomonas sp.]
MTWSVYVSGAIVVCFILAAAAWSVSRVLHGSGALRLVHVLLVAAMLGGAICLGLGAAGYGMLFGIVMILTSLAVMLLEKHSQRWLVCVPFITGALLASGIPFGAV